jgi:hypothetical protein
LFAPPGEAETTREEVTFDHAIDLAAEIWKHCAEVAARRNRQTGVKGTLHRVGRAVRRRVGTLGRQP